MVIYFVDFLHFSLNKKCISYEKLSLHYFCTLLHEFLHSLFALGTLVCVCICVCGYPSQNDIEE